MVQNNDSEQHLEDMKLYDYADRLREFFPSLSPKDDSHQVDRKLLQARREIQTHNEKKLNLYKTKITAHIKSLKELRNELR
jgi:hypothetical protein